MLLVIILLCLCVNVKKTQQRREKAEKALVNKSAPPNRRHSELNRQLPNSVEMNTSVDTPVKRGRGRPRKSECLTPLSLKPLTVVSSKKTKTTTKKVFSISCLLLVVQSFWYLVSQIK